MACINCGKIRSAILHGKMAEAAGLSVKVLREKIGLDPKTADVVEATEVSEKPTKAAAAK